VHEDTTIRQLSAEVFIMLLRRLNEQAYVEKTLEDCFLRKLELLMQREKQGDAGAANERENLIKSLMFLLENGSE
jgi:hypothetical protein